MTAYLIGLVQTDRFHQGPSRSRRGQCALQAIAPRWRMPPAADRRALRAGLLLLSIRHGAGERLLCSRSADAIFAGNDDMPRRAGCLAALQLKDSGQLPWRLDDSLIAQIVWPGSPPAVSRSRDGGSGRLHADPEGREDGPFEQRLSHELVCVNRRRPGA